MSRKIGRVSKSRGRKRPSASASSGTSTPPKFAWLLLGIAGEWLSVTDLAKLGSLLYGMEGYVPPTQMQWREWLDTWWREQRVERATSQAGTSYYQLSPVDRHRALSEASKQRLGEYHDALRRSYTLPYSLVREARLALYCGDEEEFEAVMQCSRGGQVWIDLVGDPPVVPVYEFLPETHQQAYLEVASSRALQLEGPASPLLLESSVPGLAAARIALRSLAGDSPAALEELAKVDPSQDTSGQVYAAMTVLELSRNDVDAARACALKALNVSKGRKKYPSLDGPLSTWVAFCAITGTPEQRAMAELMMSVTKRSYEYGEIAEDVLVLRFLSWLSTGAGEVLSISPSDSLRGEWNNLSRLWHRALIAWGVAAKDKDGCKELSAELGEYGFHWARAEMQGLVASGNNKIGTLASMYTPKELWQRRLDQLAVFSSAANTSQRGKKKRTDQDAEHRIVWRLFEDDYGYGDFELDALLQKRGKSGFSKGRSATANALRKLHGKPWLGEADSKVIHAMQPSRGNSGHYELGMPCIAALEGNPNVVWLEDMSPADVVCGKLGLTVERKGKSIILRPSPYATELETQTIREGNRLLIYRVDQQHLELCAATGTELHLPAEAEDRLAEIMGSFPANIALHSDIAPQGREACEVAPEPRLVVLLRRSSEALRVSFVAMPLGLDGPTCEPGKGKEVLVAEREGQAAQTRRNLEDEAAREHALVELCPTLRKADVRNGQMVVEGLAATLAALHELHLAGEEIICLWKEGEPLQVDLSADLATLQLKFGDTDSWLTADIAVDISKDMSIKAHDLVSKLVPGASQFVKLDDGRFLALSEELSKKLEQLAELGSLSKKGLSMGPANAYALSAWLGDLDTKAARKGAKLAKKRLAKVRESVSLVPVPPHTFEAELRPYQVDGYRWLGRLAHWGGGALLCDDMGLGKTVQMLAILAERGPAGPALVVAPVSVIAHWASLMQQFAPTLHFQQLVAGGRDESISGLGPRDVLVVSYGLLHNEIDQLCKRSFQTIILDEAQAIKNPQSRRAKAAFKLQAEFRVVTTGTPIENNLGELWSIMNFVNPGLLGSSRHFSEVYGKPIQNDGDREASRRLRRLIAPFLLRRTKAQVLTELPPKTEITLEVQPGREESQFYAAVRDEILAEVAAGMSRPAQQRIQILAALMKLRRIACHPTLVDSGVTCGSAKQDAFLKLVEELRDAGHRILVFSQFVGHLAIARANLDARKISYQYLDGSTTKARRKKAVDAFQNGEGDVFLISLKAGGVGLHLTGADYVIHLDPWWNPAVEDQASDRAHRMGQTRPVTVYRLVTKGTVEQRVLELHARKRQLAEDLISGNENSGSLGVDDLLELMTDIGVDASPPA